MRFSTFSWATTEAVRPTPVAPPKPPPRGKKPKVANFSLPPIFSAASLVLMMYRRGFGGVGEPMIVLMNGLDQPYAMPGQFGPAQLLVVGAAATAPAS